MPVAKDKKDRDKIVDMDVGKVVGVDVGEVVAVFMTAEVGLVCAHTNTYTETD